MKQLLLTTIAAVMLVGCGESQQSASTPEVEPAVPVAEAAQPKPPTAKAPDISIHYAANSGNIEAIKQHLDAGTDVNAKDKRGTTPMHKATGRGHKEIVELLIAEGADVNAKNDWGITPLYSAVGNGHKEIAELLIENGADVNAKRGDGFTPLQFAIVSGHKEIVELLIAEGAGVNAKDKYGKTPLDLAIQQGHIVPNTEINDLLRKHGGKRGEELKAEGK